MDSCQLPACWSKRPGRIIYVHQIQAWLPQKKKIFKRVCNGREHAGMTWRILNHDLLYGLAVAGEDVDTSPHRPGARFHAASSQQNGTFGAVRMLPCRYICWSARGAGEEMVRGGEPRPKGTAPRTGSVSRSVRSHLVSSHISWKCAKPRYLRKHFGWTECTRTVRGSQGLGFDLPSTQ